MAGDSEKQEMKFSVESRPPSSQLSLTFKSLGISGRGVGGAGAFV